MDTNYLVVVCLNWISANWDRLFELLRAVVPLTSLIVFAFAVHVVFKKGGKK